MKYLLAFLLLSILVILFFIIYKVINYFITKYTLKRAKQAILETVNSENTQADNNVHQSEATVIQDVVVTPSSEDFYEALYARFQELNEVANVEAAISEEHDVSMKAKRRKNNNGKRKKRK